MPEHDWNAYRELFLHEMKENRKQFNHIADALKELSKEMAIIKIEIGQLKVKASLVGGIAGLIGAGLMTAVIKLWM
ncbi:hypothetical protein LCGC14_0836730 [marine sediment metagenome]|uniref:Uncharacterized protein n=1 Tax=marine sediment metagenome TaxID=412755 RepID=A0A0F9PIY0_9ZZZZ